MTKEKLNFRTKFIKVLFEKQKIYFLINLIFLSAIVLIGMYYEEQRDNLTIIFKTYLLCLCSYMLVNYIRQVNKSWNFEKIFTIGWMLLGIALFASALFIRYRYFPVLLLYACGSFFLALVFVIFRKE